MFSMLEIDALIKKQCLGDPNENHFEAIKKKLLAEKELISLGVKDPTSNKQWYTTRSNYKREAKMADRARSLQKQGRYIVHPALVKKASSAFSLNAEQQLALEHITRNQGLSVIVGRAGTGKSYLMGAAKSVFEQAGFKLHGMSLSAKAAQNLKESSGIQSSTIAYYQKLIEYGKLELTDKDILIMDEAGMAHLDDMSSIISAAHRAKAKVILVGDPQQLQPIIGSAPFRAILEHTGYCEMSTILRQKKAGDREATSLLSQGNVSDAIDYYTGQNQVHLKQSTEQAMQTLIDDWHQTLSANTKGKRQLILAHSNKACAKLNALARNKLKARGQLPVDEITLETSKGKNNFTIGDRIVLLKNNKKVGIHNGDFATITHIKDNQTLEIQTDHKKSLTIDPKEYKHFTHGYAATIHKAQGSTYDHTFVYASGYYWDRHLAYVTLSRHKESTALYASQEEFKDINQLKERLGKSTARDNVLDYPLSYAIRRGFDPDSMAGRFIEKVMQIKNKVVDQWKYISNYNPTRRTRDEAKKVLITENDQAAAAISQAEPNSLVHVMPSHAANATELARLAKHHHTDTLYFALNREENNNNIKALYKVAKDLKEKRHITCYRALPKVDGQEGCDFNDALMSFNIKTVREQLSDMREIKIQEKENAPILEKESIQQNNTKPKEPMILKHETEWNALKSLNHPRVNELIQAHNDTLKHQEDALSRKIYGKYYRKACDAVLNNVKLTQKIKVLAPNLTKALINEKKQRDKEKAFEYLP